MVANRVVSILENSFRRMRQANPLCCAASLCTFTLLSVSFSCKDSPPQPPPPNGPDTTSHAIAWQADTLGDGASSTLYDVAILSDSLAYAVGEMYLRDSSGQLDPTPYNLAKWNGRQWALYRVYYQTTSLLHLTWIVAFSARDMWITPVTRWDGNRFHDVAFDPIFSGSRTTKAWGTSSRDFYVVGDGGFIAHYNGSAWQRVVSGTNTNLNDIWGTVEQTSRKRTVLVAASNRYSAGEKKLLSIDDTSRVDTLSWSPGSRVNTVWFLSSSKIYGGGSGLFVGTSGAWQQIFELPSIYITRIRGTAENDVWVVGAFGLCAHFNGATWKTYSEVALPNGSYEGLAVTSKLIIAVGYVGNRAVALRGRK
jgi:hypothetical protein